MSILPALFILRVHFNTKESESCRQVILVEAHESGRLGSQKCGRQEAVSGEAGR